MHNLLIIEDADPHGELRAIRRHPEEFEMIHRHLRKLNDKIRRQRACKTNDLRV